MISLVFVSTMLTLAHPSCRFKRYMTIGTFAPDQSETRRVSISGEHSEIWMLERKRKLACFIGVGVLGVVLVLKS